MYQLCESGVRADEQSKKSRKAKDYFSEARQGKNEFSNFIGLSKQEINSKFEP